MGPLSLFSWAFLRGGRWGHSDGYRAPWASRIAGFALTLRFASLMATCNLTRQHVTSLDRDGGQRGFWPRRAAYVQHAVSSMPHALQRVPVCLASGLRVPCILGCGYQRGNIKRVGRGMFQPPRIAGLDIEIPTSRLLKDRAHGLVLSFPFCHATFRTFRELSVATRYSAQSPPPPGGLWARLNAWAWPPIRSDRTPPRFYGHQGRGGVCGSSQSERANSQPAPMEGSEAFSPFFP